MTRDTSLRAVGWAQSFPVSQGARAGRRWTREHLASLAWAKDAPETVDAILLSVSELITNAHEHAHSEAQLVLTWDSHCLHVSVHDCDPLLPEKQPEDLTTTGGRGLAIVDTLADSCSTHPQASGKTVTACFVPPGVPKPRHDGPVS
ncbi:ATP-binding protein [Streptomyces sp. A0958]|uniref:ATP-binding protein n=1 Tax=Streptomyces sp. A0958 TaxID=2563101 RepID=UPI00109E56E4|nr:ATP-binding protein [Streptomyces sp. A0958]THA71392.1 ATP-binding protein [Streptomyces sp. A0958]